MVYQSNEEAFLRGLQREQRKRVHRPSDAELAQTLLATCFKEQLEFIHDPSRRKANKAGRRSGKTYAVVIYLIYTALTKPGSNSVYICLNFNQARRAVWYSTRTGIVGLDARYGLGLKFNATYLEATAPNGSRISFLGGENAQLIEKFRGDAYDLVVVDECKSFRPKVFDELIRDILIPATMDTRGTVAMVGNPGYLPLGTYYEVTRPDSERSLPYARRKNASRDELAQRPWSVHHWTAAANNVVKDRWGVPVDVWAECLAEKAANGWSDDNPGWRTEYLGEWVIDGTGRVYAFSDVEGHNTYKPRQEEPPAGSNALCGLDPAHEWRYLLGVDLGSNDATAFVVAAYSPTCDTLYYVYDYTDTGMTMAQVAAKVLELEDQFGFEAMVADTGGLGKTIVESLNDTYELYLEPASKGDKMANIALMNSDFHEGRIKAHPDLRLTHEWSTLVLDSQGEKVARHQEDHCADAALYIYRHANHHFFQRPAKELTPGTPEWRQADIKRRQQEALERARREQGMDFFDQLSAEQNYENLFFESFEDSEWI